MIDDDDLSETAVLYARGEIGAGVAAMRLLMEAASPEAARAVLRRAEGRLGPLAEVEALLTGEAFATIKGVLGAVGHERTHDRPTTPAEWGRAFDRACAVSPAASVALYTLGDPERLRAATEEVVRWLAVQGVLRADRRVLEIGCGAGRFVEALAPHVGFIAGLDVSPARAARARRRARIRSNAAVVLTAGRDLSAFASGGIDLVLAVDSFQYLVKAGVAETHLAEVGRVLKPGGELVILNWSYEAPYEPPAAPGLEPVALSGRELRLWDGVGFRLRKRAQGFG
jgi:SAM-dependent methyltransferase